jgi:hypothetical protein
MFGVANKPIVLSVIMLSAIMLSDVVPDRLNRLVRSKHSLAHTRRELVMMGKKCCNIGTDKFSVLG